MDVAGIALNVRISVGWGQDRTGQDRTDSMGQHGAGGWMETGSRGRGGEEEIATAQRPRYQELGRVDRPTGELGLAWAFGVWKWARSRTGLL